MNSLELLQASGRIQTMVIQRVDFGFCIKHIPTTKEDEVKKLMVRRTYEHLVRLRWKVMAHLKPMHFGKVVRENYGFKTSKFPMNVECSALKGFEDDMWSMVKNLRLN